MLTNKKFAELIKNAVHDLRSPIASILTIALMSENLSQVERDHLSNAAKRIQGITTTLNSSSNDDISEAPEQFNLDKEIAKMVKEKNYTQTFPAIDISYKRESSCTNIQIRGVISDFERMLSNLLDNAIDAYQGNSGVVTVELSQNDNNIILTVEDNGKGMPEEILEKLRDGIAITYDKADGSGIGMGQIRDTINKMQGKLTIESKLGSGSKFTLQFPAN